MTSGQVTMMPYNSNSPTWNQESYKGEVAAFSPLALNGGKESTNFAYLGFSQSPRHAGVMSPAAPGYSPSSLNVYSPTLPYVPQSPFAGATSPFSTSPYVTSSFYDHGHVPTSPTYSPTSPSSPPRRFIIPDVPLATVKKTMLLEAANVAHSHFDALGHDFVKHHPDAAEFADRLSHALCCVLVLDEDATSVLDYACGSGQTTTFRSAAPLLPC